MSTTWRNERGEEWGKGIQTVTTKGTVWGSYHGSKAIDVPVEASEGSTGLVEPVEATVEGFACQHPGCGKVAKSAAGLAAHARKAH